MKRILLAAAAALLTAVPAAAQDVGPATEQPLPDSNDQSESFQVGLGVAFVPDYEGSNDYRIIPGGIIRAKVSGISIFSRSVNAGNIAIITPHTNEPPNCAWRTVGTMRCASRKTLAYCNNDQEGI